MNIGLTTDAICRDSLLNELRQTELAVVRGERQLSEQEAQVVRLKKQNRDPSQAEAELEAMRETQRRHEQDRQRLLSLLQP